jgi:hypothetical protein
MKAEAAKKMKMKIKAASNRNENQSKLAEKEMKLSMSKKAKQRNNGVWRNQLAAAANENKYRCILKEKKNICEIRRKKMK